MVTIEQGCKKLYTMASMFSISAVVLLALALLCFACAVDPEVNYDAVSHSEHELRSGLE